MAARWNAAPPGHYQDKLGPVVDKGKALQSIATYWAVAVAAGLASKYGAPLLRMLRLPGVGYVAFLLGLAAVLSALGALYALGRWRESSIRLKAQAALNPSQRALLGLPLTPPPKPLDPTRPAALPLAPRPAAVLATPLSPAQRPSPVVSWQQPAYGATPQSTGAASLGASTQAAASPASRRSPWSASKAVATPEQLQHYFNLFASPDARREAAAAAAPPQSAAAYQAAAAAAAAAAYDQGDGAGGPLLPLGRDAPLYRPSIIRKAGPGSSSGGGGGADALQPSADSEATAVIRDMLRVEVGDLVVWTERFREWLSLHVLRPLVHQLESAHSEANALLAPLSADRLPPLEDAVAGGGGTGPGVSGSGGGGGGGGGGSGAGGSGGVDVDAVVAHLMALHRYQQLLLVLRGRRPAELLPPSPAGYVAAAARRLARGTCLKDFSWSGGGSYQGRPWTSDLPTDSALVFYLFAAFLDAPGWHFPLQPTPEGGRGAPLYLGQLRSHPPASYSALLSFRPDKPGPGTAAVVGTNLSSREPRYTLVLGGTAVTLEGRDGAFHALLLFLSYHAARRQGLLGGRLLSELDGLEDVLAGGAPAASVPQRVWSWWFPPQC